MSGRLSLLVLALITTTAFSEEQSLRDRFRAKVVERMLDKKLGQAPEHKETAIDTSITKAGDYAFSFTHNDLTRKYLLHVPANYDAKKATPLIVAFHGGGGSMDLQATDQNYKLISKSEKEGFVVAFPNGYSKLASGRLATWNAGKCCGAARDKNIDDVGFVRELVSKIKKQVNVDGNKVFAIGMSNGGMMTYRLACELSDVFTATASVAGTDNTATCSPGKTISMLHIHAKNDDHVLFNGGVGKSLDRSREAVTDFTSVPATISKWVKMNACNETPKRVLEKTGAYCDLYSGCKDKKEIQLCVTDTGAHSWPGGEKTRGSEPPSQAISANDVMWEFFTKK